MRPWEIEDHLRALEDELMRPEVRSNAARLHELLADDFEEYGSSGRVFTKKELIAALVGEVPSVLSITDFRGAFVGEGVALATYRSVRRVDGMADIEALRSSLWVLRDGRWQVRFHQGTRLLLAVAS